jgi:hypothetical protein
MNLVTEETEFCTTVVQFAYLKHVKLVESVRFES